MASLQEGEARPEDEPLPKGYARRRDGTVVDILRSAGFGSNREPGTWSSDITVPSGVRPVTREP